MPKLTLYRYQFDAIIQMLAKESLALFADMGLGKTIMTLSYFAIKKQQGKLNRCLIIAPKRVCDLVWPREVEKWDHMNHLTCFRLTDKKDLYSLKLNSDILIINVENIFPYIQRLSEICDCLIVDESTTFKNHNSKRFKYLKPLLPKFKSRIILSGTPIPNSYLDLFAQIYIVDLGKRFTPYITVYRKVFFDAVEKGYSARRFVEYEIKEGAEEKIKELIAQICLRIDKEHNKHMPNVIYDDIFVRFDSDLQKKYDTLEKYLLLELEHKELLIDNASVNFIRCHQFTNGVVYGKQKQEEPIHTEKIEALKELVESLQGKSLLIAYWYNSDLSLLKKYLPKLQVLGESDKKDIKLIDQWNHRKIKLLAGHPMSIGHGLNLQFGGNHIAWFSLITNYEKYDQYNARLIRPGQTETVHIHRIVAQDTIDEYVLLKKIDKKAFVLKDFLDYLKNKQ